MFHSARFELLSLFIILFPSFVIPLWNWSPFDAYCDYVECCKSPWVKHDFVLLAKHLSRDFYDQHLVTKSAFKKIKRHVENDKPLVLSFHGPTGTGKTFFTHLIAESFYKYGTKSRQFFHCHSHFSGGVDMDFLRHANDLTKEIESRLSRCEYSLFIIDDADFMNPKLYDVLLPNVDYRPDTNEVSYNKAIFIFISNILLQ